MVKQLKEKIEKLLKAHPRGLTITELSKLTNVSTITVSKTLAELKGAEKIEIRQAGSAKLIYWR